MRAPKERTISCQNLDETLTEKRAGEIIDSAILLESAVRVVVVGPDLSAVQGEE